MTRASLTCVLLIALAAAQTGSIVAVQPASATTIPFEVASRHIVVQVKVNNSRPLSFVLDTGANRAIVRLDTAKELGLTLQGEVRTGGAGSGAAAGQLVKGANWSLVGLDRFSQPIAFTLPMPFLSAGLGRKIDGIIGGEFIKQFVLELDYQARSIRLHDRQTFRYGARARRFRLNSRLRITRLSRRHSRRSAERRSSIGSCSTWDRVSGWRSTARSWPNTTSWAATSARSGL